MPPRCPVAHRPITIVDTSAFCTRLSSPLLFASLPRASPPRIIRASALVSARKQRSHGLARGAYPPIGLPLTSLRADVFLPLPPMGKEGAPTRLANGHACSCNPPPAGPSRRLAASRAFLHSARLSASSPSPSARTIALAQTTPLAPSYRRLRRQCWIISVCWRRRGRP